jgi:hypothetical protein
VWVSQDTPPGVGGRDRGPNVQRENVMPPPRESATRFLAGNGGCEETPVPPCRPNPGTP